MQARILLSWLIPSLCLAYNPSALEILTRMETALRRPAPVVLQVAREDPGALSPSEHRVKIPADSPADTAADRQFMFPFSALTLPRDETLKVLPSLFDGVTSVKLERFNGSICYLLEGRSSRLWLRKSDFIPLQLEYLSAFGERTTYTYLDLINISEKAVYPSRTEVVQDGTLLMVERLIPAHAHTDQP